MVEIKIQLKVPEEIIEATQTLEKKGFEAYLAGGCVRDLIMNKKPKDWDITTNASPEEIIKAFGKTFYENNFGTVTVVNEETTDDSLKKIEITPYRIEGKYSDKRHPDEIKFAKTLEEDLKRRDFTINAMAYSPTNEILIDNYDGIDDIRNELIRTVEDPDQRFSEDALRMIRGVRFSVELGFKIEEKTGQGIIKNSNLIKQISEERVRDEFIKIIMSEFPKLGIERMCVYGLLRFIIPELEEGIKIAQNKDHIYDVWEHILRSLDYAAKKSYSLEIRLGALFHDIGKPRTREWVEEKKDFTFYGHEVIGARMVKNIMERLKFTKTTSDIVVKLVRNHMFFSEVETITLSAVRRTIQRVGPENIWDLINVRICDRKGMGRPKEEPFRLRKYKSMIDEALRQPTSVGMLKIDGSKIMEIAELKPSPQIGWILHALLEEVMEDPELNTEEYLANRAKELSKMPEKKLQKLGEKGKEKKEEIEEEEIKKIRAKHHVE